MFRFGAEAIGQWWRIGFDTGEHLASSLGETLNF
jgi:hypothetical protein